ncbi:LmeA family phospholipid-binding protein [Streptomyces sp. Tue6028]|uniref:LmeA family phospholipid-binding protein n=1 Tax=Streptomyces sp. Tue6028 TaxID=2036037 RepID=UPI003D75A971
MRPSRYVQEPTRDAPYGDAAVRVRPRAPRRRRQVVAGTALLALLAGGVAADRVAATRAQSRTAEAFQDGMGTPERPTVHVSGFPVLTQLAEGSLRHVDITAHDIPARGTSRPLPVTRLSVGLDGLRTSGPADEARARSVTASAFLSYEDLSDALGLDLSPGDAPGRIDATAGLPLVGDIAVSTAVSAAGGNRIAFTDVRVTRGHLIPPAKALLDQALTEPVPLRNIPDGLRLRSVTTTDEGITARFTGKAVTFRTDSTTA